MITGWIPGMGNLRFFWEVLCEYTQKNCVNAQKICVKPEKKSPLCLLKPADEFQVEEAGGEAVGDGVGGIGEVLDQHIGDRVGAVDQVEDFEGGPDIFEVAEGAVAAAVAFFAVEQQGAEPDVDTDIGVDGEAVAIAEVAGDIERQVAAVQEIQVGFEVLVGGEIVLEKEPEVEEPVAGPSYPAHPGLCAVQGVA